MRIVIVGDGKIGSALAEQLSREGHEITIVDRSETPLQRTVEDLDILSIEGNGATYATQMEAGVVGFVPLWTRRYALNFLLIPLVLVNLLSNWPYQFDIGFQYHYGTSALLFIILAVTVGEFARRRYRPQFKTVLLALVLIGSLVFSMTYTLPRLREKKARADDYLATQKQQADEILDYVTDLPKDQTYLTNTMLGAAFGKHPFVYELDNLHLDDFDFSQIDCIVMDARFAFGEREQERLRFVVETYGFEVDTAYAPVLVFKQK